MGKFGGFGNIVFALIACTAIAQLIYYFNSKRKPSLSELEKSLWRFISLSVLYVVLIFTSYLHLSTVGTRTLALPGNEPIEAVIQSIARNQQQMKMELEEFREVLLFVLLLSGVYVISAVGILQQFRSKCKKLSQTASRTEPPG